MLKQRAPKDEIRVLSWLASESRKALGMEQELPDKGNIIVKMACKNNSSFQDMVYKLS